MTRRALEWTTVDRATLAEHLQAARIDRSQAVGATSLYHCRSAGGETVAIALPDGSGLIVGLTPPAAPRFERRKKPADDGPPAAK